MFIAADISEAGLVAGVAVGGVILGFIAGRLTAGGSGSARSVDAVDAVADGDVVEIYVGNLSYDMTETEMDKEFRKFGKVKSARIIQNRFNGKSKGFGFVEMPVRSEAEKAIKALHNREVKGRKLRVNEARSKSHDD